MYKNVFFSRGDDFSTQGRPPVAPNHTFGTSSGCDELSAGELIRGFYPIDEQKPDKDWPLLKQKETIA